MDKNLSEVIQKIEQEDAHHRLVCALEGRPYKTLAERQRLSVLTEAVRRGEPITDALAEGRDPLPEGIHERLAAALGLTDARDPLHEDAHRCVQEILTGGPTVAQELYERLARAVQS